MDTVGKSVAELLDLNGKVAIVTGAGQGLGYEIAGRLGEVGAAVVVNDLDAERARQAAARLAEAGGRAAAAPGDVTRREDVEAVLAVALGTFGRIDILVNNAGIWPMEPFLEAPEDLWSTTFRVNVIGPLLCTQVVARKLIEQGAGGSIVNVMSIAAVVPHADSLVAYGASKAGLGNVTRVLAKALAPHGIRVNAVVPGGMETLSVAGNADRRSGADIPLGYRAHPDEVALGALFLASGLAAYVTGAELLVDGGAVLR